jgi:YVTN family beta-propeller protein
MSYVLGVDLGTTFVAAAMSLDGHAQMCTLGNQTVVTPSVAYLSERSSLIFGEAAERRALSQPDRVEREFKRRLGDPTPVVLGGVPYQVTALMGALLRDVMGKVTTVEGRPPDRVALTYPANWGPYRRELFDEVPQLAGLSSHIALSEPEAAAAYYATSRYLDEGDIIAVYDLGGGTFDATVLRKHDGVVDLVGEPEGIERLGGIDFDEAIIQWINYTHGGALAELDMADPQAAAAMAKLRQECVQAKEALSSDTETTIPVLLPNRHFSVRLTRREFEGMVRAPIEATIGTLVRAVRSAHLDVDQLSAVLLVGGSSRIPLIERMIAEELRRPTVVDAHPKYSVSLGAAMVAARQSASADAGPTAAAWHVIDLGAAAASSPASAGDTVPGAASDPSPSGSAGPPEEQGAESAFPTTTSGGPPDGNERAARSRRIRAGLAAAAVVVVAGGLTYTFSSLRDANSRSTSATVTPPPASTSPATTKTTPSPTPSLSSSVAPSPTIYPAVAQPHLDLRVKLGSAPNYVGASPNGHQLYIANGNKSVVVYDITAKAETATIPLPGPAQFLSFSPDGRYVYVSIWDKPGGTIHEMSILDTRDDSVKPPIPVDSRPFLAAVTPDGTWLYVPNHDTNSISVVDTRLNRVVDKIPVPPNPHYVSFSRDGKRAYVANHDSNLVTVIDTATRRIVKEVSVGLAPHSLEQNPKRPEVMNVNWGARSVDVINTNSNKVIKTIPVGDKPLDIHWSPDGRFAYVVNNASNNLSIISADTWKVTETLPTGKEPTSIAVLPDGSKGYVSNSGDSTLTVIDLAGG